MIPKPTLPQDLISMHLQIEFKKIYERGWYEGCSSLIDQSVKIIEKSAESQIEYKTSNNVHIISVDDKN